MLSAVLDPERAPGAEDLLARSEGELAHGTKLAAHAWLWRTTGDPGHLDAAWRLLEHLRNHAPIEYRVSLIEDIPQHREVAGGYLGRMPK